MVLGSKSSLPIIPGTSEQKSAARHRHIRVQSLVNLQKHEEKQLHQVMKQYKSKRRKVLTQTYPGQLPEDINILINPFPPNPNPRFQVSHAFSASTNYRQILFEEFLLERDGISCEFSLYLPVLFGGWNRVPPQNCWLHTQDFDMVMLQLMITPKAWILICFGGLPFDFDFQIKNLDTQHDSLSSTKALF